MFLNAQIIFMETIQIINANLVILVVLSVPDQQAHSVKPVLLIFIYTELHAPYNVLMAIIKSHPNKFAKLVNATVKPARVLNITIVYNVRLVKIDSLVKGLVSLSAQKDNILIFY